MVLALSGFAISCSSGSSSAPGSSSEASSQTAAGRDVLEALAGARNSRAVHYVLVTPLKGGGTRKTVGDVGLTTGRQTITTPGGGQVVTLVINGRAYFRGNLTGLMAAGMSSADAKEVSEQWRFVPSGSSLYRSVVDQVTLGSVLSYITPRPPLAAAPASRRAGKSVVGISGGRPVALTSDASAGGSSVLYVSTSTHLPVEYDYTAAGATTPEVWHFSRWGVSVRVTPPPVDSTSP